VRLAGLRMARFLGMEPKPPRVAAWELMDLTKPERPQLLCRADELPRDRQ
jgi:hypothetical protein